MTIEKFIKNDIHYIKEIFESGTINIYPDPEFQPSSTPTIKPPLPPLTTITQILEFIIDQLHLKDSFSN